MLLIPIALKYFEEITRSKSTFEVRLLSSISSVLSVSVFLILVPLQVDRSFSVWMLNKISQQNPQKFYVDELKNEAARYFSPNNGEINRRINEQVQIGNLEITSAKEIKLSNRGSLFVRFHKVVARIFNLNKKYSGI